MPAPRRAAPTALAVAVAVAFAVSVLAAVSPLVPAGTGGGAGERPALERERDGVALVGASVGIRRPQADDDAPPLALPSVAGALALAVVAWAGWGAVGHRPPARFHAGCRASRAPPPLRVP